jgi:hypothetical protein
MLVTGVPASGGWAANSLVALIEDIWRSAPLFRVTRLDSELALPFSLSALSNALRSKGLLHASLSKSMNNPGELMEKSPHTLQV